MVIEVTFDVTDVYISTTVSPVYVNVSFEAPSGGGGTEWGDITGTLSDQTDLQTALDAKVPYAGATANVDLGEYELKAGQVEFDQTPTGTAGVGVMRWNDSDGTLDLGLKGGNVTLQLGQEQVARVVNKSGVNLLESAYQVVKVTDAQGQRLAVDLAQGNNDANSTDTIGIVTENIDNNQEGFITTSGIVRNINTTGGLQGETWNDGDVLYLSPTTAGAITNIKPTAPNHTVILGYVVYAHAVNGKIFVKCDNGYELGELHDVYVPTPSNNDGIFWNSTNLRYENKSVSSALGYTPANAATTLTINGVTYDLSTSRTWTISAGISGSGASGQVAYWTGASSQSGSNDFQWNGTNIVLGNDKGIVLQTAGTNRNILLQAGVITDNFAGAFFYPSSGTNVGTAFNISPKGTGYSATIKSQISVLNTDYGADTTNYELAVFRAAGNRFSLSTGKAGTGTLRPLLLSSGYADGATNPNHLWLLTTGNVGINSSSDTGERLQVQGTTLLNGNVTFSSSTGMFWDATNSRLGIGTNAPTDKLSINNGGLSISDGTYVGKLIFSGINASTGGFDLVYPINGGIRFGPATSIDGVMFQGYGGTHPNFAGQMYFDYGSAFRSIANKAVYFRNANTGQNYTNVMMLSSGSNVLIGSTTDSGERLQVTGTMKVTDNVSMSIDSTLVKGFSSTNTNSGGVSTFSVFNNLNTYGFFRAYGSTRGTSTYSELSDIIGFGSSKSIKIFTDSDSLNGGTNSIQFMAGGYNNDQERARIGTYGMLIGTKTSVASAIFTIESTTKGFLPPRMTTTQKNAIGSPAAGLVVYDTTLAKLCVYTTAWETITSV